MPHDAPKETTRMKKSSAPERVRGVTAEDLPSHSYPEEAPRSSGVAECVCSEISLDLLEEKTLSGTEWGELRCALLHAFHTKQHLKDFFRDNFDRNLNEIAEGNLRAVISSLMEQMQAEGSTNKLIVAAMKARPKNPRLRAFVHKHYGWKPVVAGGVAPPPKEQIEAYVRKEPTPRSAEPLVAEPHGGRANSGASPRRRFPALALAATLGLVVASALYAFMPASEARTSSASEVAKTLTMGPIFSSAEETGAEPVSSIYSDPLMFDAEPPPPAPVIAKEADLAPPPAVVRRTRSTRNDQGSQGESPADRCADRGYGGGGARAAFAARPRAAS